MKTNTPIGVGSTIIIVILTVLCLTLLSVLSFLTAYSDLKLSKKTEEITADYYYAHGIAEEKLFQIYDILVGTQKKLKTDIINQELSKKKLFNYEAFNELSKLEGISAIKKDERDIYSDFEIYYEALGNNNQKICVNLNIYYDEIKGQPYYDIFSWKLSNIELPSYEDGSYNLWEGIEE